MTDDQACEVPLTELLRTVPEAAKYLDETPTSFRSIPAGDYCHRAADEIDRLRDECARLRVASEDEIERLIEQRGVLLDDLACRDADAERYRWLRDEGSPYALLVVGKFHESKIRPFYDADLDAAIDAAMTPPTQGD